jgi:hypothetical protein
VTQVRAVAPVIPDSRFALKLEAGWVELRIVEGAERRAVKRAALLSPLRPSAPTSMMLAAPIRATAPMAKFRFAFRL